MNTKTSNQLVENFIKTYKGKPPRIGTPPYGPQEEKAVFVHFRALVKKFWKISYNSKENIILLNSLFLDSNCDLNTLHVNDFDGKNRNIVHRFVTDHPEECTPTLVKINKELLDFRSIIIVQNSGLAFTVAKNFMSYLQRYTVQWKDIKQCAYLGLFNAIEHYDPSYNVRFSTYGYPWIHTHIRKALVSNELYMVRVPMDCTSGKKKITRYRDASLDATLPGSSDPWIECIPSNTTSGIEAIDISYLYKNILPSLGVFTSKKRDLDMFCMRFGLPPYDDVFLLKEIGRKHNLSRERVRQVINRIIGIIKEKIDSETISTKITQEYL